MGQTEVTRQSDEIYPPIVGSLIAVAVTTTPQAIDFTTFPQLESQPVATGKGSENTNPLGQYFTFVASADVWIAFTDDLADVASLSATATTTISAAGAITIGTTVTAKLPSGVPYHFRLPSGNTADPATGRMIAHGAQSSARFLGVLTAAGTATLSVWVSSR